MGLGISVICPTNKANSFENILNNFKSQDYDPKELIIGLNYDIKIDYIKNKITNEDNIKILPLGSRRTLGECLNISIEHAKYPIIAKFDDDDYYSPQYLSDMEKLFSDENIQIVGKACYYVYFTKKKIIGLMNAGRENMFVDRVAGATLTFRKEVFQSVKFPHLNLGEDVKFCQLAKRKGYKIYSTNRFHYVYIRNMRYKHTWKIDNNFILKHCKFLTEVEDYKEFILKMCQ